MNYFILSFLALLTFTTCLSASTALDQKLTISAERVDYLPGRVTLEGKVDVLAPAGRLRSEKACLITPSEKERQHFSMLQLFDHVELSLTQGGTLLCDKADLHYDSLTGNFRGGPSQTHAVYSDLRFSSCGTPLPLEIKSDLITVQVTPETPHHSSSPRHCISSLVAQGSVAMRYTDDFLAFADRAIYRDSDRDTLLEDEQLSGMIYLVPDGPQGKCEIRHQRGDAISAQLIRIDADRETLFFDRPTGQVFFEDEEGMLDRIDFSAQALNWDHAAQKLTLQHDVTLRDLGMGTLFAKNEVEVAFDPASNEHEVRWIYARGPTHLVFEGEEDGYERQLYCFGGAEIDNRSFQVQLKSPRDEGYVVPERQIRYKDNVGEAQADDVTIIYQYVEGELVAEKILIVGNVYMVNHAPFDPNDQTPVLQYAKADAVEYFPQEQTMLLTGKGRRVLFFDKLNNVQLSAPAVRMSRDKVTGKEAVQGIGDVRLRLIGQEMDDLLQPFEDTGVAME